MNATDNGRLAQSAAAYLVLIVITLALPGLAAWGAAPFIAWAFPPDGQLAFLYIYAWILICALVGIAVGLLARKWVTRALFANVGLVGCVLGLALNTQWDGSTVDWFLVGLIGVGTMACYASCAASAGVVDMLRPLR